MQQGGSQYVMTPEMPSFAGTHMLGITGPDHLQHQQHLLQGKQSGDAGLPEIASPISIRPPAAGDGFGGFPDDDATLVGEEGDRCVTGNRWPRQETLALLKIRSEMDSAFREATIKGPLWEGVSRKLAELGYTRSAKKCKEKFENVHKYYKRTKEVRGGRQDGKSYRFFSQLEALHSTNASIIITTNSSVAPAPIPIVESRDAMANNLVRIQQPTVVFAPTQIAEPLIVADQTARIASGMPDPAAGISFSSTSSSSSSDSEERANGKNHKRKRSGSSRREMKAFFEGLMKQVVDKQEAMQRRFLETIEKRERDRIIREEAWKLQETAKFAQEQEIAVQERAIAASRDATVIAFLQKFTGETDGLSPSIKFPAPLPLLHLQHHHHEPQNTEITLHQPSLSDAIVVTEQQETGGSFEAASSRWPKSEVLALIKIRSGLEFRYLDAGPKGPLWEEISAGMKQMGYFRSAKRCKEKWENINKYFKKVKESNKKRPEDAKTCPYFHQLEALYRKKTLGFGNQNKQEQEINSIQNMIENAEPEINHNKNTKDSQVQTSNGGQLPSLFEEGGGKTKKPEDIMKQELIQQQQQKEAVMDHYDKMDEPDSDNLDQEVDEDEEGGDTEYKIQYQKQNSGGSSENTTMRSFLALVQ